MDTSKRFLGALVLLVLVRLVIGFDDETAWGEFKSKFNKNYSSPDEENNRKQVFLDNLRYIESHNTKSKKSFVQGINELSDLTTDEINKSRNGFRMPSFPEYEQPVDGFIELLLSAYNRTTGDIKSWYDDLLSPPGLDYRQNGRVSRVKDQGACGSCWSFATTGALESILARHNRSRLLSEQNLVDCSRSYGNYGCSGGLMDQAFRYVRDHGIMASHDYPYTGKDEACKFRHEKSIMRVRGSTVLPRGNEAFLRLALALTGPIPIAIDAGSRSFHSYKKGVYNDHTCQNSNNALNHAVLLVGYGTDQVGGEYWIVKNSWGNKWGDAGYIKMARNRHNQCGIASFAVVPLP